MLRSATLLGFLTAGSLTAAPAEAQQWTTASLSQARGKLAAATVGDLALFAGGDDPLTTLNSDVVDVYDAATDAWIPMAHSLSVARAFFAGTGVGQYALFAGGGINSTTPVANVDVYDAAVGPPTDPLAWSVVMLSQARSSLVATTVGSQAIFAGGVDAIGPSDVVDTYDAAIGPPSDPLAWSATTLSQARSGLAAATVGDLAIFAGGLGALGLSDRVDIYHSATGTWSMDMLSVARSSVAAAAVGTRAYFGGGPDTMMTMSDVLDVYDATAGTFLPPSMLPEQRGEMSAAAIGNTVIFAGGIIIQGGMGVMPSVVHMLNTGTGQWDSTSNLSQGRWAMGVATVGGKALFAGGRGLGVVPSFADVDIYEPVGVSYCAATPNSTGGAATISSSGSSSVGANDLTLTAQPVPNQPGVFFYGPAQVQQAFGNGTLCVGTAGPIGIARLPVVNATGNVMTHTVDNTMPPTAATQILPGSTWNFQAWFRDPAGMGALFDLSDALSIQFTP